MQNVKLSIGKGIDVSAKNNTFLFWANYLLDEKEKRCAGARYVMYKSGFRHLEPVHFVKVMDIKPIHIQAIINNLAVKNPTTKKPASKYLLLQIRGFASQVFEKCIQNKIVEFNPAKYVEVNQSSPEPQKAISDEQIDWIENTPHRMQTAAMIMLYAGPRRGEVIALNWKDIDLCNKNISVNKTVEMVNGKPSLKIGKARTDKSIRLVPIPQKLCDYLQSVKDKKGLVVANRSGGLMSNTVWKKSWESYMTDLNIKYGYGNDVSKHSPKKIPLVIKTFTAHQLRHTYATMLYKAGIDVLTAMELLGHSKVETTLNIYTHLDGKFKKRSIDKFDVFLKDASNMQVVDS